MGEAIKPRSLTWSVLLVALSVAVGSFLFGYDTGVISGALLYIEPDFQLEDEPALQGLIVVATLIGAFLGAMTGGKFADWWGRKRPLMGSSFLFIGGGALMFWSPNVGVLITGRFVVGFAIGVSGVIIPLYIAECAPASVRGTIAVFPQLFVSSGILVSYLVDFAISIPESESWRLMLGVSVVPAVIQLLLIFWLPESPRWLVGQNRLAEAETVLVRLRETTDVLEELHTIVEGTRNNNQGIDVKVNVTSPVDSHDQSSEAAPLLQEPPPPYQEAVSWRVLLKRQDVQRAFLIGMGLQMFQQLSGINAVVYYTPDILKDAGVDELFEALGLSNDSAAILATAITYSIKIPAIFLSMYLIDRVGRRTILLFTIPILVISLTGLSVSFALTDADSVRAVLSMFCIAVYGCCFAAGLGCIATLVGSEIFPTPIRAVGLSACLMTQWAFNILVSETFPILKDALGVTPTFAMFASLCFCALIFVYFCVPETKGKVLESTIETIGH